MLTGPLQRCGLYYVRGLVWLIILAILARLGATIWDANSLRPAIDWVLASPQRVAFAIGIVIVLPLATEWTARKVVRPIMMKRRHLRSLVGLEDSLMSELAPAAGQSYQVVIVNWPSSEIQSIGVLTSTFSPPGVNEKLATVYVPNAPDPTKGQIRIVREDSVLLTGWTVVEFSSYMLSYGAAAPDRIGFGENLPTDAVDS